MGKTLSREEELTQVGRLPFAAACGVTLAGDAHGNVVGCGMTVRQGLASLHQAWGGDSALWGPKCRKRNQLARALCAALQLALVAACAVSGYLATMAIGEET